MKCAITLIVFIAPVLAEALTGGRIALPLRDQNGRLQIFTINPDGTDKKQLTFEGDNGLPDWSPDGRRIAFTTLRLGQAWIAVMDAEGIYRL